MKVELMFCEETILQEIGTKEATRDDIALTYAFCRDAKESQNVNFRTINEAIVKRWSLSALEYIKGKAAKLMDEKYGIKRGEYEIQYKMAKI